VTKLVVGVDGGGSKTTVVVAGTRGPDMASIVGSPSAVRPGEAAKSADTVARLVAEALEACGKSDVRPAALCVGVAGVGRDAEFAAFFSAMQDRDLADELVVLPDAVVALEDAFGDDAGILLIAGTGSVCYGRGPTGKLARCGGWGFFCGDEGSGAWIGRRALSIVTASADGREPETALIGALLHALTLAKVEELVAWGASATVQQLAQVAPIVVSVAATGDLRANSILTMAAEELVLHVRTLARDLFTDERASVPVAFSGGLMQPGAFLRKLVEHRLKSAVPGAAVRHEPVVPVRGAIRVARRSAAEG
jgi:glucosamine kinase